MPAYIYDSLGGIADVKDNEKVPSSKRSRDRDRYQTFTFDCDPTRPFTGIVHLQGSVDDPSNPNITDYVWSDITELEFNQEGGRFFVQLEVELASVRAVCKEGNYWAATNGSANPTSTAGTFTINGVSITIGNGLDASAVAAIINADGTIISDGIVVADVINTPNDTLRIYRNDGTPLTLANTSGTPLDSLGLSSGTFSAGRILTIKTLR